MFTKADSGPDFIVIGAQKCGTTTLWEDLRAHPGVAMAEKESDGLLDPQVTTPHGRSRYAGLFHKGHGLKGEVCTNYSTLPNHPETAERAHELNSDARIIYIVREPIARVISHHHHDYGLGLCGADIDIEVHRHDSLVSNTRYGTQLAPWIKLFGRPRVTVIRLEDYAADRESGVAQIQDFLGLHGIPPANSRIHNSSANKVIAQGGWRRLAQSAVYQKAIRPALPEGARKRMLRSLLPSAPPRPRLPSPDTLQYLTSLLKPEVNLLSELTGEPPLWNLDKELEMWANHQ